MVVVSNNKLEKIAGMYSMVKSKNDKQGKPLSSSPTK